MRVFTSVCYLNTQLYLIYHVKLTDIHNMSKIYNILPNTEYEIWNYVQGDFGYANHVNVNRPGKLKNKQNKCFNVQLWIHTGVNYKMNDWVSVVTTSRIYVGIFYIMLVDVKAVCVLPIDTVPSCHGVRTVLRQ